VRWNGEGYHNQLSGDSIPKLSKPVSIFDALEGIPSLRQEGQRLSPEEALGVVEAAAGRRYDPEIVSLIAERRRTKPPEFEFDLEE